MVHSGKKRETKKRFAEAQNREKADGGALPGTGVLSGSCQFLGKKIGGAARVLSFNASILKRRNPTEWDEQALGSYRTHTANRGVFKRKNRSGSILLCVGQGGWREGH